MREGAAFQALRLALTSTNTACSMGSPFSRSDTMSRIQRLSLSLWAAVCMIPQADAQLTTATVTGTVTDASGAAIPDAMLSLENVGRGVIRTATSGAGGRFSFDFVAVGTYRLTASQSGFNNAARTGLELSAGQVLDLPIQLEIKQQTQSVEVTAEVAGLDTTTAEQVAALVYGGGA